MTETLNSMDIQKLIPHRYPFLLVDKITDIVPGTSAVGIKNVTINEPFFMGHFPDNPIMPGVLIIEAMAQTAGALVAHGLPKSSHQLQVFFMSLEKGRFRKPVIPGDTLFMAVEKSQSRGQVWKFDGIARVNGHVHAEATFTAMIKGEGT